MNDAMLFSKTISIDSKGRCFLPTKNTRAQVGEKIYLFYSEDRSCIIARDEASVQRMGKEYIYASPKEREEMLEELGNFLFNSVGIAFVDTQGRLPLTIKACSEVNLSDSVFIVGCFDELRFYPSEKVFRESIGNKQAVKAKKLNSK